MLFSWQSLAMSSSNNCSGGQEIFNLSAEVCKRKKCCGQ